jgi:ribosome-associated translation inhibitor RaiA
MDVSVSGRHTTVSEPLRIQAVEKIGRLDRYLSGMERAEVHFWEEKNEEHALDRSRCEELVRLVGPEGRAERDRMRARLLSAVPRGAAARIWRELDVLRR